MSALRFYAYETRSMRHDIALVEFAAAIDIVSSLVREAGRPAGSSGRTRSHVLPLGDLEGTHYEPPGSFVTGKLGLPSTGAMEQFHWVDRLFHWWTNCSIGGQTVPLVDKLCAIGGHTVSAVKVDNQ